MKKKKRDKKDDQLIRLALITALITLAEKLIELIIKILELIVGGRLPPHQPLTLEDI